MRHFATTKLDVLYDQGSLEMRGWSFGFIDDFMYCASLLFERFHDETNREMLASNLQSYFRSNKRKCVHKFVIGRSAYVGGYLAMDKSFAKYAFSFTSKHICFLFRHIREISKLQWLKAHLTNSLEVTVAAGPFQDQALVYRAL